MKYFLIFLAALLLASCECSSCDSPKSEKKVVWVAPNGDTARYYDRLIQFGPPSLKVHKFLGKKNASDFFLVELYGNCAIMDDDRRLIMPAKCPGDTLTVIHDTIRVSSPINSTTTNSSNWSVP